ALCCVMSAPAAYSDSLVGPQEFRTMAVFELVVSGSKVLRSGPSKIVTESAFVTLTHTLMGNTDGLEIQFFTKPITEAGRADILERIKKVEALLRPFQRPRSAGRADGAWALSTVPRGQATANVSRIEAPLPQRSRHLAARRHE